MFCCGVRFLRWNIIKNMIAGNARSLEQILTVTTLFLSLVSMSIAIQLDA